jgi:hypothetical protein
VAPVVIVAVYSVLTARLAAGVKTAVTPVTVTEPETAVVPCFREKVVVPIVKGIIASLNVAATDELSATSVALLAGFVELTVGAIESEPPFPLLPHPATKVTSSNARNHIFENTLYLFIFAPSLGTF